MVHCTIYKIISPNTQDVYIGSTKLKLTTRFSIHKSLYNKSTSKKIINAGDSKIVCLEEGEFLDRKEAYNKEKEYIYKLRCEGFTVVNKNIPSQTTKEWYQLNKQKLKEYYLKNRDKYKQYYLDNRDYLLNKQKQYYYRKIENKK